MRLINKKKILRMKRKIKESSFFRLFNFKDEYCKGRSMLLTWTITAAIANVFVSGTFQTAFLAQNGIDIVRVGIITMIPYMSWFLGIFSPKILQRFQHRRGLMIFKHCFYYVCVIFASTIMPYFVKDYTARTVWFGVLMFIGNVPQALVGTGATAWHMHFIPEGEDRSVYYSITNIINNVSGVATAVIASFAADALSVNPNYPTILNVLRMISFVVLMVGAVFLFVIPVEFPYEISEQTYKLSDTILKPLKAKKFMLTIMIALIWNCVCNFNGGTWTYYLLDTVKMPYIMTYLCSIIITVGSFFLFGTWRKMVKKYSWSTIICTVVLVAALCEVLVAFTTEKTLWVYVIVCVISGVNNIGIQLVFADIFYMNLPREDTDLYSVFYNFAVNVCVLIGQMLGTWLLSMMEKPDGSCYTLLGLPFYGSQFLVWIKAVCLLGMALYVWKASPYIQPKEEKRKIN